MYNMVLLKILLLAFIFVSKTFALEVVINPYEGLENLREGEILAFHYDNNCNPCVEIIEPEPYEYDDNGNSAGCESTVEYIPVPAHTPFRFY